MKIIYIPLDERPCNYDLPEYALNGVKGEVEIATVPHAMLGYKKTPANLEEIDKWLEKQITNNSLLVLSMDMYMYGGLIPSRLHFKSEQELKARVEKLVNFKNKYPNLKIYPFSSIMRNPHYNSQDEEPDYYEHFGVSLWKRAYISDKIAKGDATKEEKAELKKIVIPEVIVRDYETRRRKNIENNVRLIELVKNNVFEMMIFPQDDSSPYGYTRNDQDIVLKAISQTGQKDKFHIYPGSDETGVTVVARAYADYKGKQTGFYLFSSTKNGMNVIPKYEDREMIKTLEGHIRAVNGKFVSKETADFCLAINTPLKDSYESFDKYQHTSEELKDLKEFVSKIKELVNSNKKVILVDKKFVNGGDKELIKLLDQEELLNKLYSYMGWNTYGNSLGAALGTAMLANDKKNRVWNNVYNVIDAVAYQPTVRIWIRDNILEKYGADYFSLRAEAPSVIKIEEEEIKKFMNEWAPNLFEKVESFELWHPWNRMFEIGIKLKLK